MSHTSLEVRSTSAQISLFVEYMAANKDFANGLGEYSGAPGARKANKEWETLRKRLKEHGADKSVRQWKQTWRDLKKNARRALSENQAALPIVSDLAFKVLETIGPSALDCPIEIAPPKYLNCEVNPEKNSLSIKNETKTEHRNTYDNDLTSDRSSDPDVDVTNDNDCEVEVIVPMPQIGEVLHSRPANILQFDPPQEASSLSGFPQLTPKPQPRPANKTAFYARPPFSSNNQPLLPPPSVTQHQPLLPPPSVTQHQQIKVSRKRNSSEMFQHASNEFVALEQRRLRLEEERDRRLHEREMETLKLESQRIEVQRNNNQLLQHLLRIAQNVYELLQHKL